MARSSCFGGGVTMTLQPDQGATDAGEATMTQPALALCHLMIALAACVGRCAGAEPGRAGPRRRQIRRSPIQGMMQDSRTRISRSRSKPATLEVRDKNKMATFSGNVQVVQGDTTMKCQTLVVFYGAGARRRAPADASAAPASPPTARVAKRGMPQGAQDIRRIEARGGVTVITKDQNASGDLGIYDLKKKTITLTGNVVVSQGKNVMHGERVVVDTVSGNAHLRIGFGDAEPGRALHPARQRRAIGAVRRTCLSVGPIQAELGQRRQHRRRKIG